MAARETKCVNAWMWNVHLAACACVCLAKRKAATKNLVFYLNNASATLAVVTASAVSFAPADFFSFFSIYTIRILFPRLF